MNLIGFTETHREALRTIDFAHDIKFRCWLFLERYPDQWCTIFSVKLSEVLCSVEARFRGRHLQIYHGDGSKVGLLFSETLSEDIWPLGRWFSLAFERSVKETHTSLSLQVSGVQRSTTVNTSDGTRHPYKFTGKQQPAITLLGDDSYNAMMSFYHIEGRAQRYLAFRSGRIVSNIADQQALGYQRRELTVGTANYGMHVHTLASDLNEHNFKLVEKKTKHNAEKKFVSCLRKLQNDDYNLRRIFPRVYWHDEVDRMMTYLMEYVPNVGEKLDSVDQLRALRAAAVALRQLDEADRQYAISAKLPDTLRKGQTSLELALEDDSLNEHWPKLSRIVKLRAEIVDAGTVLAHNDVWWSNVSFHKNTSNFKLIDFGLIGKNYYGADMHHVFVRYSSDTDLVKEYLSVYAEVFNVSLELVRKGALTYAVERELARYRSPGRPDKSVSLFNLRRLLSYL
ncbi:hypothetical protein [Nesterenkonia natronophila]|uniref:Aminoglycoside phosphotransferase domain-containing protein n=1 Tax=Nesterenkonia natronophila TaxID=2174932 RepID=A0A3A4G3S1_9MICC|nr:hypothetical protein [Nesterenkonia natronophila]RJN32969.1 hypothetical protein D3250_03950 [Nesterenkonia natronophila]